MKLTERNYRSLFKATVIVKGLIATGELIVGFLFLFLSYATLLQWVYALTGDELLEQSPDFPWNYVVGAFHGFTATPQGVWSFIFLSHGIVKLILVVALLKEKMWAFPWGAGIFAAFIVYQIWQMSLAFSVALLLVTLLDAAVVFLTLHEYRYHLRRRRAAAAHA